MIVLGIHEGHDAGAAILKDGRVISAVNEERLSRKKLFMGVPERSIQECMRIAKLEPGDIDQVAVAGTLGVMASLGWEKLSPKKRFYQFLCNNTPLPRQDFFMSMQRRMFRPLRNHNVASFVKRIGIDARLKYLDHHRCHAASAYFTSGKKDCLVATCDGSGDSVSTSVYLGRDNTLTLLKEFPTFHSIAYYYGYVTQIAGYKMFKHEGKITGLAAHGNPDKAYNVFERCFAVKNGRPVNTLGKIGHGAIHHLQKELAGTSKEDYSAAVQARTEDVITEYIHHYVKKTRIRDVSVAGGLFANVKVNQKVLELQDVDSLFIHPHMGDGGLAVGAALALTGEEMAGTGSGLVPYRLDNVYFGTGYSNDEVEQVLGKNNIEGEYVSDIEAYVAEKIADKKIVGHFDGRMEYGPRALGNRSILADPTDKTINDWLNKRLKRTEFMPFAPSILDSAAPDFYENYAPGDYPARFMTITFNDTETAQKAKAVVHVDNTTRPQVVSKRNNTRYHKILRKYQDESGLPIFVNTSFNTHEEPIVCSPNDALRSHLKGTTDVLVMGNWVVEN